MINLTLVTREGCVHCAEAKKILQNEITPNFPNVEVEYIDMLSEAGQKMVQEYGIMTSPGIIVNGELFSVGGLDKDKLIKRIRELA